MSPIIPGLRVGRNLKGNSYNRPIKFYGDGIPYIRRIKFKGRLIVIEGPDGSGRSSQVELIKTRLESDGHAVTTTGLKRSELIGEGVLAAKQKLPVGQKTLISSLKGIRADQLKKLMMNAVKLSKKSIPTLTSLKSVELENSIDSATLRLNSDIVGYLLTVLEDPDDIEDLHSLRKSVRDLRYTLEMLPSIKRTRREISTLTRWQDTLGDVIDSAVIESYLGTLLATDLYRTWAHQERTKRRQKYREFLNIYEKSKTLIPK